MRYLSATGCVDGARGSRGGKTPALRPTHAPKADTPPCCVRATGQFPNSSSGLYNGIPVYVRNGLHRPKFAHSFRFANGEAHFHATFAPPLLQTRGRAIAGLEGFHAG